MLFDTKKMTCTLSLEEFEKLPNTQIRVDFLLQDCGGQIFTSLDKVGNWLIHWLQPKNSENTEFTLHTYKAIIDGEEYRKELRAKVGALCDEFYELRSKLDTLYKELK